MQAHFDSLSHAVKSGPTARFVSDFRTLESSPIQMVETICPAGSVKYSSRPELTLTCTMEAEKPGRVRPSQGMKPYRAGDFELAPPVSPETWHSDGTARFINLAIPTTHEASDIQLPVDGLAALHTDTFRCDMLRLYIDNLWQSLSPAGSACRLLSEGLYRCVIGQLLVLADRPAPAPEPSRCKHQLCPKVLSAIDEAIADSNETKLSTQVLADLAVLSVSTFVRRFKATTGQSVHQYVLSKRVSRAEQLLGDPTLSIASIAHRCGFSSQSHMTDVFRARLGTTPANYRDA